MEVQPMGTSILGLLIIVAVLFFGIIIIGGLIFLIVYLSKKKPIAPVQTPASGTPPAAAPAPKVQPAPAAPAKPAMATAQSVEISLSQGSLSLIENKISEVSSFLNKKIVQNGETINFEGVNLKVEKITPGSPAKITTTTEINISPV